MLFLNYAVGTYRKRMAELSSASGTGYRASRTRIVKRWQRKEARSILPQGHEQGRRGIPEKQAKTAYKAVFFDASGRSVFP